MKHSNEAEAMGELLYRQSVAFLQKMVLSGLLDQEKYQTAEGYLAQEYGVLFRIV